MENQMPYIYGPGSIQGNPGGNPRPQPNTNCHCMREIREINRRIENLERRINRIERRLFNTQMPLRDDNEAAAPQYTTYPNDNYML